MAGQSSDTVAAPIHLRCEYHVNPVGIDALRPRLSWEMVDGRRGARQTAYQIVVAHSLEELHGAITCLWDSGKVHSRESVHQPYAGPALQASQRCYWKVRIWDAGDQPSPWSEPAYWEMGLLAPEDWRAGWIEADLPEDPAAPQPAHMLRTEFQVDGALRSARAYITSHGLYEAELNGHRVGDQVLTPGWTSYDHRLQMQIYDVTGLVQTGNNALGVTLADGWYRGYLGFQNQRNHYGDKLALLCQIRIEYADGHVRWIGTDDRWRASTGPVRMADIYQGETYDARLEKPGWSTPGYDDRGWAGVRVVDHAKTHLVAPAGPPVRTVEEIQPLSVLRTPAGEIVFDFGQNLVGWCRLRVAGEAGAMVVLRHAEVLDVEGNFYTDNLRSAAQTVRYTLKGDGEEVYEPRFTFQGFRYVAVSGFPGVPTVDSLTAVVVHSNMAPTGTFECSQPLLNQLQHNIVWGQKGNFVDVPTDCPQRDERLGWTGDAQVFIRTACFNMDVAGFFTKWLADLAADQAPNGSVPFVVPDVLARRRDPGQPAVFTGMGSAAWGDAAVICPWTLYLCYGDSRILERQYTSMAGWVEFMAGQAGDRSIWDSGFHFGDWLAIFPEANPLVPAPKTSHALIATAFFAYSASIVAQAARVLGKDGDAQRYEALATHVRRAFCAEFVTPNGRIDAGTQTAYVLALMFDLLPEEQRPAAVERLVADIRGRGNHLSTGFVGASYVCPVLSKFGRLDVAFDLLNQRTFPSWLYPVKRGATTIWERWDGIKPDGTFQDASMNSFNHYAYGAIGDWMYRTIAGIDLDPAEPAYQHVIIRPQLGAGLTHAEATLHTVYGRIRTAWELTRSHFRLEVTVPANTWATVVIPATDVEQVTEGGRPLREVDGVVVNGVQVDGLTLELGAGEYRFASTGRVLDDAYLAAAGAGLSKASRLGDLLSDPDARAILFRHLGQEFPQLPQLQFAMGMKLEQAATIVSHLFTPDTLAAIDAELAHI